MDFFSLNNKGRLIYFSLEGGLVRSSESKATSIADTKAEQKKQETISQTPDKDKDPKELQKEADAAAAKEKNEVLGRLNQSVETVKVSAGNIEKRMQESPLSNKYKEQIGTKLKELLGARSEAVKQVANESEEQFKTISAETIAQLDTFNNQEEIKNIYDTVEPFFKQKAGIAQAINLESYKAGSGDWKKINEEISKLGISQDGIKKIQKELGIAADGRTGPQTINAIAGMLGIEGIKADFGKETKQGNAENIVDPTAGLAEAGAIVGGEEMIKMAAQDAKNTEGFWRGQKVMNLIPRVFGVGGGKGYDDLKAEISKDAAAEMENKQMGQKLFIDLVQRNGREEAMKIVESLNTQEGKSKLAGTVLGVKETIALKEYLNSGEGRLAKKTLEGKKVSETEKATITLKRANELNSSVSFAAAKPLYAQLAKDFPDSAEGKMAAKILKDNKITWESAGDLASDANDLALAFVPVGGGAAGQVGKRVLAAGGKIIGKKVVEKGAEVGLKVLAKEGLKEGGKILLKEGTEEGLKIAAKEGTEEIVKEGTKVMAKEVTEEMAKEGAKVVVKDVAEGTGAKLAEGTVVEAGKQGLATTAKEGLEQGLAKTTGTIVKAGEGALAKTVAAEGSGQVVKAGTAKAVEQGLITTAETVLTPLEQAAQKTLTSVMKQVAEGGYKVGKVSYKALFDSPAFKSIENKWARGLASAGINFTLDMARPMAASVVAEQIYPGAGEWVMMAYIGGQSAGAEMRMLKGEWSKIQAELTEQMGRVRVPENKQALILQEVKNAVEGTDVAQKIIPIKSFSEIKPGTEFGFTEMGSEAKGIFNKSEKGTIYFTDEKGIQRSMAVGDMTMKEVHLKVDEAVPAPKANPEIEPQKELKPNVDEKVPAEKPTPEPAPVEAEKPKVETRKERKDRVKSEKEKAKAEVKAKADAEAKAKTEQKEAKIKEAEAKKAEQAKFKEEQNRVKAEEKAKAEAKAKELAGKNKSDLLNKKIDNEFKDVLRGNKKIEKLPTETQDTVKARVQAKYQELAKSLQQVKTTDELKQWIQTELKDIGVAGSGEHYSAKKLLNIIESIRSGEGDVNHITSSLGLRDKVHELLGSELAKKLPASLGELWPKGLNNVIKQGASGNCYLLAALNSMKGDPEFASQLGKMIKKTNKGWEVTFHQETFSGEFEKWTTVITKKDIAEMEEAGKAMIEGSLGDRLLDRAYARMISKMKLEAPEMTVHGGNMAFEGGNPREVFHHFYGNKVATERIPASGAREFLQTSANENMVLTTSSMAGEDVVKKVKGMTSSEKKNFLTDDSIRRLEREPDSDRITYRLKDIHGKEVGIQANHAYSIGEVDKDGKWIEVVNPHDTGEKRIKLPFEEYAKGFRTMHAMKKPAIAPAMAA